MKISKEIDQIVLHTNGEMHNGIIVVHEFLLADQIFQIPFVYIIRNLLLRVQRGAVVGVQRFQNTSLKCLGFADIVIGDVCELVALAAEKLV